MSKQHVKLADGSTLVITTSVAIIDPDPVTPAPAEAVADVATPEATPTSLPKYVKQGKDESPAAFAVRKAVWARAKADEAEDDARRLAGLETSSPEPAPVEPAPVEPAPVAPSAPSLGQSGSALGASVSQARNRKPNHLTFVPCSCKAPFHKADGTVEPRTDIPAGHYVAATIKGKEWQGKMQKNWDCGVQRFAQDAGGMIAVVYGKKGDTGLLKGGSKAKNRDGYFVDVATEFVENSLRFDPCPCDDCKALRGES
jgi:hypothetical protein